MTYVVVALVVTNVLTLLNLLLLFGVIRRLRVQQFPPPGGMAAPGSLPVGTPIDAFVTTDTDGLPLRRDELPAGAVIGFFSPGCTPCEALIPKFVAYAEGLSDGRKSALAVVVGSREEAADYVARLSPAARVVVESQEGDLVRAFQVTGYPTLFQLDGDGRLLVSDASSVERLAVPAA